MSDVGKLIITIFICLITLLLSFFCLDNYSYYIFFIIIFFSCLLFQPKELKIDSVLLYSYGVLGMFIFYFYWHSFNGLGYLTGRVTDDWNFDIEWGKNYYDLYRINPIYLYDFLGPLHNSVGYVYFVSIVRYISDLLDGYETFNTRLINIYLLILTGCISARLAPYFYNIPEDNIIAIKRKILYCICLIPVMSYYSFFVLRETLVIFLIMLCIYQVVVNKKKLLSIIVIFICLICLWFLRKSTCFVLLLLCILISTPTHKWKWYLPILGVPIIVLIFLISGELIGSISRGVENYNEMNVERHGDIASRFMLLPFGINIIPRIIYAFIVPAINFNNLEQIYLSVEMYLKILFFPILMSALFNKNIDLRLKIIFLVLFFVVVFSTLSHRHFSMFIPFGIILVVLQLEDFKSISLKKYIMWMILFIILLIISFVIAFSFN
ncbi:hypothetical protein [Acinetobacter sp.]|uniref:hypothetical protein n=1 Tax=Acinetobacter sp. TaxID=472 RepID=UPI0028A8216F|nr:hypothetical protein [Acinetobacter sp.]